MSFISNSIERARHLEQNATLPPWTVHPNSKYWAALPIEEDGDPNRDNNAAFVVTARNAFSAFLELWEAAEAVKQIAAGLAYGARPTTLTLNRTQELGKMMAEPLMAALATLDRIFGEET